MKRDKPAATAASKARAESIHRQIDTYKEAAKARKVGSPAIGVPGQPETPAEFIHRRMQEVEPKSQKRKGK